MSVKARVEKNFRRAKVKPGRRKRTRVWFSWRVARYLAALALVSYGGFRAVDLVLSASALHVSRVVVRGNVRLSNGEVDALVHGLYGKSIITAELDRYRARLLESPWVADAALRRLLPSTIEVFVSERQPVGICRLRSQLYLIDREGIVIDEFGPQYAEFDLPIIDGLVRAPRDGEPSIDPARARLAAAVLDDLSANPALVRRVSQIDVSDLHDAVLLLDDDAAQLRLGDERFLERLKGYLEVAAALKERVPDIDYVDLRFDERVYVRPRGGSGVVPAARTRGASKF